MLWKIFYDDGTTFSDLDGSVWDAPGQGVVCIADRKQAVTVHKFNFYYWNDDCKQWWGSDEHGLVYQLTAGPARRHIHAVLQGANVTDHFLQNCMAKAFEARTND